MSVSRRTKIVQKSDILGIPRSRLLSLSTSTWVGGVPSQMGRWMTVLDFVADDEFDVLAEIRRLRPVGGSEAHNPKNHFFDPSQILCMCLQTTCRFASVTLLSRSCHVPVTLCHALSCSCHALSPCRPAAFTSIWRPKVAITPYRRLTCI